MSARYLAGHNSRGDAEDPRYLNATVARYRPGENEKNSQVLINTGVRAVSCGARARSECGTIPMFQGTDLEISFNGNANLDLWDGGYRLDTAIRTYNRASPYVHGSLKYSHVRVHDSKYVDPR